MPSVLADLGHAWLAIRRRPFAMVVPVLTMAIGIGASTAVFSALYAAMLSPLPYQDAGRLLRAVLFDVPPTDVVAFAVASVALTAAAVAACLQPAWRAMHVNPIVALGAG